MTERSCDGVTALLRPISGRCPRCGLRLWFHDGEAIACPVHGKSSATLEDVYGPPEGLESFPSFPSYRVTRVIGQGGFGIVFAAEDDGGYPVAIKLARTDRPGAAARLDQEIRVLSGIGPPHVPAVRGSGCLANGAPYVVMDFVNAPTLATLLATRMGRIPVPEALGIHLSTIGAVEAVHARGWVHRDIKPENIFIDGTRAILVDFGLVARSATAPRVEGTIEGEVVGTAEYMAPEQCDGRVDVDARADIYALGVILYELIAGLPPFWGRPAVVRENHRSARPPRLSTIVPGLPSAIDEIAQRCLAKAPEDRFATTSELRATLISAIFPTATRSSLAPLPIHTKASTNRAVEGQDTEANQRRTVVILLFESDADAVTLRERLGAMGGQLAHVSGGRYASVFDTGDNPARKAERAARDLVADSLTVRAFIDLAPVTVQRRRNGARRFLSHRLSQAAPDSPPGVTLTSTALAALSGPSGPPVPTIAANTTPVISATAPLIGRDAIIESLTAGAARVVRSGESMMVSIISEGGYGKSHLSAALAEKLQAINTRCQVLVVRAEEPVPGGSDRTLRDLLSTVLHLPNVVKPGQWRRLLSDRTGSIDTAAAVALALDWTSVDTPELAGLEAAPGALQARLTLAAGEVLRRRARERPLMVVLDDAHHADDTALGALEYAALAEAHTPIWICALARPRFERIRPSWGTRASAREIHHLGPLDPTSAATLCRRLLLPVENVPESAVEQLVARAQASPLLLVELIRGLKRQGVVRRHARGSGWYLATDELHQLPNMPLLEWSAQSELDALPAAVAAHARLCALLGAEVTIPEIEGVLARIDDQGATLDLPLDASVGVRRLASAGLLVERAAGRFVFRHALVREEIARGTPSGLRLRIHRAAAAYYAALPEASRTERRLSRLALHAAAAGLANEAEHAYATLANAARSRHAYLEAEALYSRAFELATNAIDPDGTRRAAACRGRGAMRYRLERYHDALSDLSLARETALARSDIATEIELLLDEATVLDWMGEYKSSEERVTRAASLTDQASQAGTPLVEARLLLGRGRSAHRFSREEEAAVLLEESAAGAERLGDEGYETLVIATLMLGFIHQGLGRLDASRALLDRAVALCEERRDLVHLGTAINNRAQLWAYLGDMAKMKADFAQVLSLGRSLGFGMLELFAEYNLGEFLYLGDDLASAEPHVNRAIEIEQQRTGGEGRPVVTLLSARLKLYRGDEAGAGAIVTRIRARQEDALRAGHADMLMVPSEDVLCTMVELTIRDASATEWDALEARSTACSVGQEHLEVLELRAIAALRHGRGAEAREQMEKALVAAARIPNVLGMRLARRIAEARLIEADTDL